MFTPAEVAQEISAIASMFEAQLPAIDAIVNEPTVIADITYAVDDLKLVANAFAMADNVTAPSLIQRLETDVNAVLAVLAESSLKNQPQLVMVMRIAQVLLPTIVIVAEMLWM